MTRRRGPSPASKQARTSFISTPETSRAFLGDAGGLNDAQVEVALQGRALATDVRSVLTAYEDWVFKRMEPPLPLQPEGKALVLRIPAAVQNNPLAEILLEGTIHIARVLSEAPPSPAYFAELRKQVREWRFWTITTLAKFLKHPRKLEAGIITLVTEAAGLPPLQERHLAALAVLTPDPLEPPQPNPQLVKSRTMNWRYALDQRYETQQVLRRLAEHIPPSITDGFMLEGLDSHRSQALLEPRKQDSTLAEILRQFERLHGETEFGKP
ncbi:hypothetical protein [Myxococcus sp. RHSTA-1-4]|uniref:hypothetical protein n=1 Tax=Myxococcus sp. RHSTA-1-4 TaxID=2874601 RepID=UPI001CBFD664|nr:hypothetical protein [Myxococcus sp. RHSTA-1-4]MBZ4421756.1 hypothetical protein [Myxococcus sp. RHSTA-1-4]